MQLDELRDQIALHFALEEAYGYFNDPQHETPHLDELAAQLRDEHQEIYFLINTLADDAQDARCHRWPHESLTALCDVFLDFARRLDLHESQENELIFCIYDEDLGVGD